MQTLIATESSLFPQLLTDFWKIGQSVGRAIYLVNYNWQTRFFALPPTWTQLLISDSVLPFRIGYLWTFGLNTMRIRLSAIRARGRARAGFVIIHSSQRAATQQQRGLSGGRGVRGGGGEFGEGRGEGRFVQHEADRVAGRPAAAVGVLVEPKTCSTDVSKACRQIM